MKDPIELAYSDAEAVPHVKWPEWKKFKFRFARRCARRGDPIDTCRKEADKLWKAERKERREEEAAREIEKAAKPKPSYRVIKARRDNWRHQENAAVYHGRKHDRSEDALEPSA